MLELIDIWKSYEGKPLLQGVSFTVQQGETICLLGASGSGKSTILRIIAGLEDCEAGIVSWDGTDLSNVPVHNRNFGLMFQDYALFPHKSVAENVGFGLKMKGTTKAEQAEKIKAALSLVDMESFVHRRVTDLSGGEQQRVALARALAPEPRLLMLDEPLAALDRALRDQLVEELRHILSRTGVPAVYVTHDQQEAYIISDRMLLMNNGRIVQQGKPAELYRRPNSLWAATFLGISNQIEGVVKTKEPCTVETQVGLFTVNCEECGSMPLGNRVTVLVPPTGAALIPATVAYSTITGRVCDVVFFGEGYRIELALDNGQVFIFTLNSAVAKGDVLSLFFGIDQLFCLAEQKN